MGGTQYSLFRMGVILLDTMAKTEQRMSDLRLPIYNVHGDKDKLCELSGSRLLHEKASSTDKTLQVEKLKIHASYF